MGSFYTSITLRSADRTHVRSDLAARGLTSYLSPSEHGALVVFARDTEEQDLDVLDGVAADLSARHGCVALAVMNHDDSVLIYSLFERGQRLDDYNSAPDYFGDVAEGGTRGGDPETLARAFGVPDQASQLTVVLGIGTTSATSPSRRSGTASWSSSCDFLVARSARGTRT
jgi:hypothetical protein